jgi:hypothetical protein
MARTIVIRWQSAIAAASLVRRRERGRRPRPSATTSSEVAMCCTSFNMIHDHTGRSAKSSVDSAACQSSLVSTLADNESRTKRSWRRSSSRQVNRRLRGQRQESRQAATSGACEGYQQWDEGSAEPCRARTLSRLPSLTRCASPGRVSDADDRGTAAPVMCRLRRLVRAVGPQRPCSPRERDRSEVP